MIDLGEEPGSGLRFTGQQLEDLDADTARQARDHLVEWASLSEPLVTGRSPWAGAQVTSDSEAQEVLNLVDGLAHDTVRAAICPENRPRTAKTPLVLKASLQHPR